MLVMPVDELEAELMAAGLSEEQLQLLRDADVSPEDAKWGMLSHLSVEQMVQVQQRTGDLYGAAWACNAGYTLDEVFDLHDVHQVSCYDAAMLRSSGFAPGQVLAVLQRVSDPFAVAMAVRDGVPRDMVFELLDYGADMAAVARAAYAGASPAELRDVAAAGGYAPAAGRGSAGRRIQVDVRPPSGTARTVDR